MANRCTDTSPIKRKGRPMKEILILMAILGVWILLQAYILPKMGIDT
ncbi:conserved hypothetical protein [Desulfosarcina cetonica]|nr:conserved hypothetical protein [Desulfosarcina cetonica]